MHLVAFHVEPSAAAKERIAASCSAYHADTDYQSLLDILFRSARLFHPEVRCAVLTDERTPFDSLSGDIAIHRFQVDPDRVMFSRLLAQIEYVQQQVADDAVVFLDSDMIVNSPGDELTRADCDLMLTYRDHPEMPLNGGVISLPAGSHAGALRFLERVCVLYAECFADAQHWWGDQHALIAAVGHEAFRRRTSDRLTVDHVRLGFLPCNQFNYSPENWILEVTSELTDKKILHFKGERKRLMPLYWDLHLAGRERAAAPPDPARRLWKRRALQMRGCSERALAAMRSGVKLPGKWARSLRDGLLRRAG
jgi:hypothetical protein